MVCRLCAQWLPGCSTMRDRALAHDQVAAGASCHCSGQSLDQPVFKRLLDALVNVQATQALSQANAVQAVRAVAAWAQHDAGQSLDQPVFKRLLDPLVALLGQAGPDSSPSSVQSSTGSVDSSPGSIKASLQEALVYLAMAGSGDAFTKPLHHAVSRAPSALRACMACIRHAHSCTALKLHVDRDARVVDKSIPVNIWSPQITAALTG